MALSPSDVFARRARKLLTRPSAKSDPARLNVTHLEDRLAPAVTGTVFLDYDANGVFDTTRTVATQGGNGVARAAVDRGVGGVVVTAYGPNNAVAGQTVTTADGTYTLNVAAGGPYRVEFTSLPAGYYFGPQGTGSNTAVQFVQSGSVPNVNLSLIRPEDVASDNPLLLTSRYVYGGANQANAAMPAILSFENNSGSVWTDPNTGNQSNPTTHAVRIPHSAVGTTWGLGFAAELNKGFAAAFTKRHSGWGPAGPGAIYAFNGPTDAQKNVTTATPWFTFNPGQVADTTAGSLYSLRATYGADIEQYNTDGGNVGWDAVGKTSLGGLDVSDDGRTVFVMNLYDRSLYRIAVNPDGTAGAVSAGARVPVPLNATGAGYFGDVRPFAVEYHKGLVYVGMVNSAESTQNAADLRAYVYAFDPATNSWSNSLLNESAVIPGISLAYNRQTSYAGPDAFRPWSPTFANINPDYATDNGVKYPQPILSGIAFDAAGNISLGIRDRTGDQTGYNSYSDPDFAPGNAAGNPVRFIQGLGIGDMLKAFARTPGDLSAGWRLENNAASPVPTNPGTGGGPGNLQGPGGGEFYSQDGWSGAGGVNDTSGNADISHRDVTAGGVLQIPGFPDVITTAFDPVRVEVPLRSGGVRWFDSSNGLLQRSYILYVSDQDGQSGGVANTFGKASGLGDLVAIAAPPPVEVGNRVWLDANENGIQDPGENGLAGVRVQLYSAGADGAFGTADDNLAGTATTDASGSYYFTTSAALANGTNKILVPGLSAGGTYQVRMPMAQLPLLRRELTRANADASANGDARDSDAVLANGFGVFNATAAAAGANHTFDIGVFDTPRVAIGDFVWIDANNNGVLDGNEVGLNGVTVNLYAADGTTLVASTTTFGGGRYFFRNLDADRYIVEIVPPSGYASSVGRFGDRFGPFEPGKVGIEDNEDHGTTQANGRIRAVVVALNRQGDTRNPDRDVLGSNRPNDANFRQDFGLFRPMSIGNVVWLDRNNNGLRDAGEPGIGGARLNLRTATGDLVATTTTNAEGGYLFSFLTPGSYRVEVVQSSLPAGLRSSTGATGSRTGAYEPATGATGDNTDHGTESGAVIRGAVVTLAFGTAPTGEEATPGGLTDPSGALDRNSDLTQDFGFFRPLSVGNLVFEDVNNDGVRQAATERGIGNVLVELLDATGTVVASTRTDGTGDYRFRDLTAATYSVRITPPAGYRSSTGTNGSRVSGPFEPGKTGTEDSQDHGTAAGAFIRAAQFNLADAGNPDENGTANLRQDFGLFRPLSLGNFVWEDANNNGKLDTGEAGIAGVTVRLIDAAGKVIGTTTTDASGNYLFTDLAPGAYVVRVTTPAGYASSTGVAGPVRTGPYEPGKSGFENNEDHGTIDGATVISRATLGLPGDAAANPDAAGTANLRQDFGFYRPLSLGNFVWEDVNNNGALDAGEAGLAGVTVTLLDANGNPLATRTTDANGNYLFTDLSAGTYAVRITPPAGYKSSTGANGNSRTGPFEPGKTGNEDNQDHGTTAGAFIQAAPVALTPGGNPDSGGLANLRQDFGLYRPLSVGNHVWKDANNNGLFDAGEAGVANITVRLLDGAGNVVAATTTDADGRYLFADLVPGAYRVEITGFGALLSSSGTGTAPGASRTGPFEPAAFNPADEQDKGTQAGNVIRAAQFDLGLPGTNPDGSGLANLRQDFGLIDAPPPPPAPLLSVGNLVWIDANNDGVRQATENGLANVTVRLLDGSGNEVATTTTDANGLYLFTGLNPGQYQVEITGVGGDLRSSTGNGPSSRANPSGPFEPASGTNPNDSEDKGTAVDNTAATKVIRTQVFTLGAAGTNPDDGGNANLRQDFGLFQPEPPPVEPLASVSGYVYRDTYNTDCVRDPANGETGIVGVTITLIGTDAAGRVFTKTATTDVNGFYQFLDLPAGEYRIEETQPVGWIDACEAPGNLGGTNPSNDVLTVTLRPNDAGVEYNFGEVQRAGLFGFVWEDVNRNRVFDYGAEPPIPGVAITITGTAFAGGPMARSLTAADSPVGLTVFTDSNGRWEFPDLPPGTYTVTEAQPAGYLDFYEANQEPNPKAVAIGNDVFSDAPLKALEFRGPLNFGEVREQQETDLTKRQFLGSTQDPVVQDPGTTPPITLPGVDVPLNPTFAVRNAMPGAQTLVAAASGPGRAPLVRVLDYATQVEKFRFYAYEASFTGGVQVATADVTGDGVEDVVTATGVGGGPRIRVFDGTTGAPVADYFAYEDSFRGGLFVAAADVTGDGKADIITGTNTGGGPRVTVFDSATGAVVMNFFAFDADQRGGVRVAAADYNGDGRADIVTTAGAGVPTRVRVFDGVSGAVLADFAPYAADFSGGVYLAAGDFDGDGTPDIVTSADAGGGPHVQVFSGLTGRSVASFFAYEPTFTGGARVAMTDVDGDGKADIVTAPGNGGAGRVRVFQGGSLTSLDDFYAFDATYSGGVFVG